MTDTTSLRFCQQTPAFGKNVILTLGSDEKSDWHEAFKDRGIPNITPFKNNPDYQIYHFFLQEPNGYWIGI